MNPRLGVGDLESSDGIRGGTRMNVSFDIDIGIRDALPSLLVNYLTVDGECLCGCYDARKDEEDGEPNSSFHVCLDLVLLISLKDKLGGKIVYWVEKKVDVSFYTPTNVIIYSSLPIAQCSSEFPFSKLRHWLWFLSRKR